MSEGVTTMGRLRNGRWLAAGLAAVLVACGGGGGGGVVAGIDRLGVTSGTITGFGSIFVNGVEYATNSTTRFSIDDNPGGQDDLRVGQQITIRWSSSDDGATRIADDVAYDSVVEGPITVGSINLPVGSFAVLGQPVLVDATTSFGSTIVPNGLEGLAEGDVVEVSGLVDAAGTVRATRVERKPAGGEYEVRGVVDAVTGTTFSINMLVVDFSAAQLRDFDDGTTDAGDFVEAKGTVINGQGQLVATEVESESGDLPSGASGDDAEVEGYVSAYVSVASFRVAGVTVDASGAVFEDGTAATLANNVKVEAEGSFNAAGVLVARKVEFRTGTSGGAVDARLTARVDSVNASAGSLVVLGVTVTVDSATRVEDKSDADVVPFGLTSLSAGDYVEVRGAAATDGTVRALLLEREDADDDGLLRGAVTAEGSQSLTVLGVAVETSGATEYRDLQDQPITAQAFFAAVGPGTPVQVQFSLNSLGAPSAPVLARELELQSN